MNGSWISALAWLCSISTSPVSTPLTDRELNRRVVETLLYDAATLPLNVHVRVDEARAHLWGDVPSLEHQTLVIEAVRRVRGIQSVESRIQVRPALVEFIPIPNDEEIESAIRLRWETHRRAEKWRNALKQVQIRIEKGWVKLGGPVPDLEFAHALRELAQVYGVVKVDAAMLWTAPVSTVARQLRTQQIPHERLERALWQELSLDPRLDPKQIEIRWTGLHEVELRGRVETPAAKLSAEADARSMSAIRLVKNHLEVHPLEKSSDREIAREIRAVLESVLPEWNSQRIGIHSIDGRVVLQGKSLDHDTQRQALEIASQVRGVKSVLDRMI